MRFCTRKQLTSKTKLKDNKYSKKRWKDFSKRKKVLKATVYVIGAGLLCFSPGAVLTVLSCIREIMNIPYSAPWIITIAMWVVSGVKSSIPINICTFSIE